MPFRFYLLVSDAYHDGRFVLGRKTNRFRFVGCCTYELNPRVLIRVHGLVFIPYKPSQ